jgi:CheY-like chemotaxis protein
MTGEEALRGIRRLRHGACKIIVYSAHAPETVALLEERLRKLGADDFTSKSPDLRALIVKVYETLGLETNTKIVRGPQTKT